MLEKAEIEALASIGMIAWSRDMMDDADALFKAVLLEQPQCEAGAIGAALVATRRGDAELATRILRQAPPTDAVRVFLGVARLALGDRAGARETLSEVAETAGETPPGRMARAALEALNQEAAGGARLRARPSIAAR